jgi:hypothetical protein
MSWRLWSNEPISPSTIDDVTWRDLQDRAARANPGRVDVCSEESRRARQAGSENFKNRRMN